MAEYYFLASLLPRLEMGYVPTLGFSELKELMKINLSEGDYKKVKTLLTFIDLENLRALWMGEPFDPRGNYTKDELQEMLLEQPWSDQQDDQGYLQDYFSQDFLRDFLAKYPTNIERLGHFPELTTRFLETGAAVETGFLHDYFAFEREWRLVMVGFRAKKLGKNIDVELQYEDPTDPIIAQLLAQKDAKNYEPPFEYRDLKPIFEAYGNSPVELQKALLNYRFQEIFELMDSEHFSIDRILGYIAQLFIVENWLALDVQKGIEIIDAIERNIK